MKTNIKLVSMVEIIYFNCMECGDPIITERFRRVGIYPKCQKKLRPIVKTNTPTFAKDETPKSNSPA